MIYLFSNNYLDRELFKIEADSDKEAVMKAIDKMLNDGDVSIETLCSALDISFSSPVSYYE